MMIEARKLRARTVGLLAPPTERDDQHRPTPGTFAQAPANLEAINSGHAEVEQDGIQP